MDKLYGKTVIRRTNVKVSTNFHDLYVYFCEIHNFYCAPPFASSGGRQQLYDRKQRQSFAASSYPIRTSGAKRHHRSIGPATEHLVSLFMTELLCYLPQTTTTDWLPGWLQNIGVVVVGRPLQDHNKKLYFVNIF